MKVIENYQASCLKQREILSVVVAIYNIEQYVEKCVRSIINQTYTNLEIILVDDGSTDKSGIICDSLAKEDIRIKIVHKANGGLSDARNAGIEASTGVFVAFVDGDDWIDEKMYETMISAMEEFDAQIVVSRYKQIYRDRILDRSTGQAVIFEGTEALQNFLEEDERYQIQNAAWNKLYRRELMKDQRFPKGKWYEDIVYTTKLLSKIKRCVYLDTSFYNYVVDREGSIMNVGFNPRIFTHQIPAYYEKKEVLKPFGDEYVGIHEYYFYKRLLLYYIEIRKSHSKEKKEQLKKLTEMIREAKAYRHRMFGWQGAKSSDRRKLDIFLKSPTLYYYAIVLNEALFIPMKEKRQKGNKG